MKKYCSSADQSDKRIFPGAESFPVFTEESSPIGGFYAMLNHFTGTEYPQPGVHEDHEGFYVVSGEGMIRVDGREERLVPGAAALAPAGVPHAIKRTSSEDLVVFIYHFPA